MSGAGDEEVAEAARDAGRRHKELKTRLIEEPDNATRKRAEANLRRRIGRGSGRDDDPFITISELIEDELGDA